MEDYRVYAANLIMHHQFSYHWPVPSTYRLPLYPILLMPFMRHLDLFLFLQTLLGIGTMVMVWKFTKSQWAILPLALDVPTMQNAGTMLRADTVFTFLIVWGFIRIWEKKSSWWLWSLAAVTRTHGIYVLLGLKRWKWLLLCLSLPLAWTLRNGIVAHQWRFSDSSDYYTLCLAEQVMHKPYLKYEQDAYIPMDQGKLKQARRDIAGNPGKLLRYMASSSFKFFFATNSEYLLDWLNIPRLTPWNTSPSVSGAGTLTLWKKHPWLIAPTVALTLMYCAYYLLFLGGLFQLAWDNRWREFWMLSWVCFALWLPAILVEGAPNYRVSLMPFICIGAAKCLKNIS